MSSACHKCGAPVQDGSGLEICPACSQGEGAGTAQPSSKNTPAKRPGIWTELWAYLRVRKKWWLAPMLVVLLALGALAVFTETSALAPFIYTLF